MNLNSNARQDYADDFPIYFDELFMSKFIEDFLDDQLTDESLADAFQSRIEHEMGPLETKVRVFKDGLLIIEADRMLFKVINAFVARLL